MPPTPRFILIAALIASGILTLAGAWGLYSAAADSRWLALGFEGLTIVAGVFGVLAGLGRFRSSHSMALFCVGGAALAASVLGFVAAGLAPSQSPRVILRAMLGDAPYAARLLSSALLIFLSGLILVLRRPRESGRYLTLSIALGAPVLIGAAIWIAAPGVKAAYAAWPSIAKATLLFALFFIVSGLISTSLHCLIRALEVGKADAPSPERA